VDRFFSVYQAVRKLEGIWQDPQYPPAINPSINDSNVIKEQRITVKPGVNANQLESDLYELAEHTRAEKGCLSYRLFEGTDESLTAGDVSKKILLLEQWDNQADLNQHKLSPWLTDFFKKHGNDFERQAVTWKELR
jgi:quinol monooxygenase YgiN